MSMLLDTEEVVGTDDGLGFDMKDMINDTDAGNAGIVDDAGYSPRVVQLGVAVLFVLFPLTTWFSATAVARALRTAGGNWTDAQDVWIGVSVQVGFVMGSVGLAVLRVADRVQSPRHLVAGFSLAAGLVNALVVAWPVYGWILLCRILTGVALAGVYPPAMQFAAGWYPPPPARGRGLAMGTMVGALTVGSAAPHLANGAILMSKSQSESWQLVMLTCSALAVVGAALAFYISRDGPFFLKLRASRNVITEGARPASNTGESGSTLGHLMRIVRDPGWYLPTLGYFGHQWELYACWSWFLRFYAEGVLAGDSTPPEDVSPEIRATASFVTFGVIGIGFLGSVVGGYMGDHPSIGRPRTAILSLIVSGTSAFVIGLVRDLPALAAVIGFVWGFSVIADSAQFSALVTECITDKSLIGTSLTMQLGSGFALTVISIALLPSLVDAIGWTWSFANLAPGPVVGILAMARLDYLQRLKKNSNAGLRG